MRRDYPSEVMEIVHYCTKSDGVSRKLVPGKYVSITEFVSDDIDDIRYPRYRMSLCLV